VKGNLVNITYLNNYKGWNNFYIGTLKNGLYQLSINRYGEVKINNFTVNDGLPNGWLIPYIIDSKLLVASQSGLFRYVSGEELSAQLPDSLKHLNIELSGYFELANIYGHIIQESVTAFQDTEDKVWISNGYNIFYIDKNNREKKSNPFKEIKMGKLSTILCPGNKTCLVGSDYGLIAINLSKKIHELHEYSTKITRIYSMNDSLYISIDKSIILPYKNNSLEFQFTAPYYNAEKELEYSYKLEGYNTNWSNWESNNKVTFVKLREGEYTFYVKARNVYGKISAVDSYKFSINPPWYRSILAYIVYGVLLILFIYILIQLNVRRLKIKNQKLENIITERTKEIREQRDKIEKQKEEITDSIYYALRIQSAVLPSSSILDDIVSDHFILYLPRDIVSGDFYWLGRVDNKVVILAADCTGHGVPGAFMSMLGVAFLNEIINKKKIFLPNKILDELRDHIIEALKQEGKMGEAKDGMDMAIVTIDLDNDKLYYAGANNPLYLIQNSEMLQIKADKMPVAIYHKITPFQLHEFNLKKNDMIYIFSDGYQDQFGGQDGRKYMTKRFREYLTELEPYPLSEQKEKLHKEFLTWKGDRNQVDDVLVFGIKL
ncbi:SpoIIE family protein phosphatase, partial [Bacteroidota bacterium]